MTRAGRLILLAALACASLLLFAGPAAANSPWWHLTSGSRPTDLSAGSARDELQEITTTTGEFGGNQVTDFVLSIRGQRIGEFATEPVAKEFEASGVTLLSAANLEKALEAPYGNSVTVSEEALGAGSARYLITVPSQTVVPIQVREEIGTARASVLTEGRPDGQIVLTAANLGDADLGGESAPVSLADALPPGLEAVAIEGFARRQGGESKDGPVACSLATLTCNFSSTLPSFDQIEVLISVVVLDESAISGAENRFSVSGGGAAAAEISRPVRVGAATDYGVEDYEMNPEEEGGATDSRAASHPFQLTTTFTLNQTADPLPAALPRNLHFKLPPGLVGDPSPIPTCTLGQFLSFATLETVNKCGAETAVGAALITINEPVLGGLYTFTVPVFNLEPAVGEPARFGFLLPGTPILLDTSLRSGNGEDYGITVSSLNTSQTSALLSSTVTFWGTPADPRHDGARGNACILSARGDHRFPCTALGALNPSALLTLPTACSGAPLQSEGLADSWADAPGTPPLVFGSDQPLPTLTGCNQVPFKPTIEAEPTSDAATSPTGLNFDLNVEDEGLTNPQGLAQSQIKKAVVTLPEGFTTNPSVAEGLSACSELQYESESIGSPAGAGCPNASKVGDVEIESPLVKQKVLGSLFVAKQGENPNHNLLTIYLVAKNPEIGVMVKQAMKVTPDPVTGQLTTEVANIPQLPFSHLRLSFRQGQRSPLITPPTCGNYTVKAELYPYSNPTVPLPEEKSFQITQGPEGQGCPNGVPPFHPNLEAGTLNNAAGTYSPFVAKITRKDSEQEITHFSIKLPPGVVGKLAGVAQCSDAQVAAAKAREHEGGGGEEEASPSCPAGSEVGHTLVGTGVGNVLAYAPGKLYLAGPYKGAPISIVSITAAKVGPFDLGTVVVREALKVNPETAEVFVDATGSDPIPHIVDGIPVHLRDIRIYVNRPEFTLNPTSCARTSTASTVLGSGLDFASEADDQPVTVTSPFQAADCASLGFKPTLKLRLRGGTRRGAFPALRAELTQRPGEAAISRARVTLPHSEFLEQGHIGTVCTRVQFAAGAGDGTSCPKASVYGRAKAITPLLDQPLEGPVFLRSNPEHELPDLVAALHGSEINIDLVGHVEGVKGGMIRNTFETVPDAPVSKFVLEMRGGKKSLLVNSTDICAGTHRAAVDFNAHNGKLRDFRPALKAKCGKAHKKSHGHRHKRG